MYIVTELKRPVSGSESPDQIAKEPLNVPIRTAGANYSLTKSFIGDKGHYTPEEPCSMALRKEQLQYNFGERVAIGETNMKHNLIS